MQLAYILVLLVCTAAVLALVVWRLAGLRHHPRASPGRLLNEWIWTLLPLATLGVLLWRAWR